MDPTLLSPVTELWRCGVRQTKMPPTTAAVDPRAGSQLAEELRSSVVASVRNLKHGTPGADWILLRNNSRRRKAERNSPLWRTLGFSFLRGKRGEALPHCSDIDRK